jgi:hypothetical protein
MEAIWIVADALLLGFSQFGAAADGLASQVSVAVLGRLVFITA